MQPRQATQSHNLGASSACIERNFTVSDGRTYVGNLLHVADHVLVTFTLLRQSSVVDVVIALTVHHFSSYNF